MPQRIAPLRFKYPQHISETGVLLDSQALYKKQTKAQYPALKNIKIGNSDITDDNICNAFINPPEAFNVLDIYGDYYKDLTFIDQGQAGTCFTAANTTDLSIKLSKLLDFPFIIDYCLFLQNIYEAYYKHGIPRFGKFIIKPDGTFYEIALPIGLSTLPDIKDFPLWTYAFDYLLTQYPIVVYPICNGMSKIPDYGDYGALPFNMGLLVKPDCLQKPEKCGIKISLQNFKQKYVLKNICSIKQYLISNGGQSLSVSISGSLLSWLQKSTNNSEFIYPDDVSIVGGLWSSYGGGLHRVNIVGWSTPEPGYTKFIFKNSWDTKANFYFTIKDEDYDNASLPIFSQIHQSNYVYSYDIVFVDYQNKSLNEIRSIFKDKIQDCCGLGTCCGDSYNIDYCEENISEVECRKYEPTTLIRNTNCDEKSFFTYNRTLNNFFDDIEGDGKNSWFILANDSDYIQDEDLKNDIIEFYNTIASQRSPIVEQELKNRVLLEFQRLSEITLDCPCCTPEPTPTPSPS